MKAANYSTLVLICLLAVGAALPHQALCKNGTLTITGVTPGETIVAVTVGGKTIGVNVPVTDKSTPDSVAISIQNAVNAEAPGSATRAGSKLTFHNGTAEGFLANGVIKGDTNSDNFVIVNAVAGTIGFDPNPFSGQDSLATNATITAGFANGLTQVSFEGFAGQRIFDLATTLNSDLQSADYVTELVDSHDIAVFANGSLSPTELDFGINSWQVTGPDSSIVAEMQVTPEPSSLLLLGSGVLGLSGFLRKRLLTRS